MTRLPTFDDSSKLAAEGRWGRASWGKALESQTAGGDWEIESNK